MPIQLPGGGTLPDEVPYTPLADALTSIVRGDVVTSTRPAVPGEPAYYANHIDNGLVSVAAAVNGLLASVSSLGVARVYNQTSGQWETWPVYVSAVDPDLTPSPPSGNYVWLQTPNA